MRCAPHCGQDVLSTALTTVILQGFPLGERLQKDFTVLTEMLSAEAMLP